VALISGGDGRPTWGRPEEAQAENDAAAGAKAAAKKPPAAATSPAASAAPTVAFRPGAAVLVRVPRATGRKGNGKPVQNYWRATVVSVEEDGLYTVQWPDDPYQRPPDSGDQRAGIAAGDLRAADNIVSAGETRARDGVQVCSTSDMIHLNRFM
jgi:hypothetical protein